jgi:hypothetical protein
VSDFRAARREFALKYGSIKSEPRAITLIALAELALIGSVDELRGAKGYLPAAEARRQVGIVGPSPFAEGKHGRNRGERRSVG